MNNFPVSVSDEILEKAQKLKIEPIDVEEKFIRGGGAGGQKINKTSSTVWLKHLPTGVEVKVQRHRSREKNRSSAYKLLVLKIEAIALGRESAMMKKVFKIKKQKMRRSRKAKEKMLEAKRHRASIKSFRRRANHEL